MMDVPNYVRHADAGIWKDTGTLLWQPGRPTSPSAVSGQTGCEEGQ